MCKGTTWEGTLQISEAEVQMRCGQDPRCVGYSKVYGIYFRPLTNIQYLVSSDTKWETFRKC